MRPMTHLQKNLRPKSPKRAKAKFQRHSQTQGSQSQRHLQFQWRPSKSRKQKKEGQPNLSKQFLCSKHIDGMFQFFDM